MASLLSAAATAARACRRTKGVMRRPRKETPLQALSCQDEVQKLSPEPVSDVDDEEPTSASSTCSGDSLSMLSHHDSTPSLPGSIHETDSECESSCCEPSLPQCQPEPHFKVAKSTRSTSLPGWTDRETFRISKELCFKAKRSRKTLCAAFLEADQQSTQSASGYLSIADLKTVFQRFDLSEGDTVRFFNSMGGDDRGLFWREAVAIMAPLFQP